MRELPPDRRADLRHLLGGAEPVEPRHQRGVQARRDRQRRRRNRGDRPPRFALALRLQHRLRHLLHEQRNAVGALDDVLPDVRRQRLVAGDARRSWRRCRARPSRLRVRAGHMRLSRPTARSNSGRNVTISSTRKVLDPVHGPTERFQARRVGPMRILEDHQHRILARQRLDLRQSAPPAFSAGAAAGSVRARDSGHRSAATASRQRARRPRSRSRSAPAPRRACRASLAACRRAPARRRAPSGR